MKKTENKALNIALNQQKKINKQVTDQLSSITTNQDAEKKALDEMSEKIDKLSAPKRKNGWKIFFKSVVAIVSWGIPLFVTILIYHNTNNLSMLNSNAVIESPKIGVAYGTEFEIDTSSYSPDSPYILKAKVTIKPNVEQGRIKATYYILPEKGRIDYSCFNLAKQSKDDFQYNVFQYSPTFFQVIPIYVLMIDNNDNKIIQYYQITSNSSTLIEKNGDGKFVFGAFGQQNYYVDYLHNYDLLDHKIYSGKNAIIEQTYKSLPLESNDLKLEDSLLNQDKILADVKKIKEIYSSVYE
ncbi:hypothetical protein HCB26_00620 [Listeria booriae]|uniref:Uncharacterized protein n=1 Tax=Listeria booriae TaxID=1552123 RepID=A0A7X0YWS6_9LIST|nr:hypothetical protein [Listeria booriae]MBC2165072.1 hypothetical protein [Listeria booriae]